MCRISKIIVQDLPLPSRALGLSDIWTPLTKQPNHKMHRSENNLVKHLIIYKNNRMIGTLALNFTLICSFISESYVK